MHRREDSLRQGLEGAPDTWLEVYPRFIEGITANMEAVVLTWLHLARRDLVKVRPRRETNNPLCGACATRSPDRPNPIGTHRMRVVEVDRLRGLVSSFARYAC